MSKPIVTGVTACAAILTAAGLAQHLASAQVQPPLVPSQCPGQPSWTAGFAFHERIPLGDGQSKTATVNADFANVRQGAGMDSPVAFTLNRGASVTIAGEAWDRGCNQWIEITTEEGSRWIHGDLLLLQETQIAVGPIDPLAEPIAPIAQPLITSQCPNASWMQGFRFYELMALTEGDYRPSVVLGNNVRLRSGVGFDAPELQQLSKGTPLIVTGEAWDSGCNQWMQVQVNGSRSWVSGKLIE
ncbi:MAG TPA: SH3 domain-containing protein [Nodosilinea sp.]|nr:SH3 domain-containing protein [Nodosilinea sp.]